MNQSRQSRFGTLQSRRISHWFDLFYASLTSLTAAEVEVAARSPDMRHSQEAAAAVVGSHSSGQGSRLLMTAAEPRRLRELGQHQPPPA